MSETFANAPDAILDDIFLELELMEPDEETTLRAKYSRIHPAVASAYARGASPRQVLELIKLKGLDLHHATLTKLFKIEQIARDERGERVCCVTCGQLLISKDPGLAEVSAHEANAIGTSEETAA
jgi:hypothetical protein